MELIEHLDRLGYDEAWIGEHHSAGFEIISSPELFIAAVAERTKRIRLGTGVVSLPYHNPLMAANRIIQLDHQTRGRVMFGVGPGLLPSDAFSMGIEPSTQRDRMVESIEVILKLFAGERVTQKSDWFNLVDATCQLRPYTWPHPEIAVASSVTPSGGKLAGRHGFGMLCVAATQANGYDALAVNWAVANKTAAEHGRTMDPEKLRLVGPVHIAETREQAFENCKFGFEKWRDYFSGISAVAGRESTEGHPIETLVAEGVAVVGTPDDAIAQIERLKTKQGAFGCFLQLAHNWANFENTKKSYDLWQRHVTPAINKTNVARETALDWAKDNKERFIGAAIGAAMQTIQKHHEDEARKSVSKAAE
jgi:limonene 1,2-monooxygenase